MKRHFKKSLEPNPDMKCFVYLTVRDQINCPDNSIENRVIVDISRELRHASQPDSPGAAAAGGYSAGALLQCQMH